LVKGLRRFLVSEAGIDRSQITFMGYWRRGQSEN
jgi:iron complex transport system ATP-binding protein